MIQNPNNKFKSLSLKEREKLWRKREILKVASRLFAGKGFYKTKMSDISRISGYSVGLLYEMFESKEQLYVEVLADKVDKLLSSLQEVMSAPDPESRLISFVELYSGFFVREKEFFQIFIREHMAFPRRKRELLRKHVEEGLSNILDIVREIIRQGKESGDFKVEHEDIVASVIVGSIHMTLGMWLKGDIERTSDEVIQSLKNIIVSVVKK